MYELFKNTFALSRFTLFGLVMAFSDEGCSRLVAAPVTFQFEATIHTTPQGIPFNTGITFGVGDVITGQFTFDPSEGDQSQISYAATQLHDFSLNINGTELILASYSLTARNNSPIADFPPASLVDGLEAIGIFAAAGTSNIDPKRSGLQLYLKGVSDLLAVPILPAEEEIWNGFILERELVVSLGSSTGGAMGFQATVGSFRSIPEPSVKIQCILFLASILLCRLRY